MCFKIFSCTLFVLIIFCKLSLAHYGKPKPNPTPYQDWDYLVFTQRWPVTACIEWQQKSKSHNCNMPPSADAWIVHGLWPTKYGHEGPFFCDSAVHFDVDQVEPILDALESNWTNVEAGTKQYSLWEHEWSKHGTCAIVLPQLDSVYNYFNKGLELNALYNIYDMLSRNNITPDVGGYTVQDLYDTVQKELDKNPTIECISYEKQSYISEIRICFNKTLDLIDCNAHDKLEDDVLSNCDLKKPVLYISKANLTYQQDATEIEDDSDYDDEAGIYLCYDDSKMQNLLNLYRMLKFAIWFTL